MKLNTENEEKKTRTIEIIENRVLKLHKVFKKVLTEKETQELPRTLQLIQGFIKARGLEIKGPLITFSKPISEDEIAKIQTTILCQLKNNPHGRLDYPYSFEEDLRVENCLYARFIGEQSHFQIAVSKMTVYAYENYLTLTGNTYTIFLANEEGVATCDIFGEVLP